MLDSQMEEVCRVVKTHLVGDFRGGQIGCAKEAVSHVQTIKRNTAEYDSVGSVSSDEASELVEFASELRQSVHEWIKKHHPELLKILNKLGLVY